MTLDINRVQAALDRAAHKAVHGSREDRAGRFHMTDEPIINADFHEIWWLYAHVRHPWGGARIAHFRKTMDGTLIFFLADEPPSRYGPRIWDEVAPREGWVKVKQIPMPTLLEIEFAFDSALTDIAAKITADIFNG